MAITIACLVFGQLVFLRFKHIRKVSILRKTAVCIFAYLWMCNRKRLGARVLVTVLLPCAFYEYSILEISILRLSTYASAYTQRKIFWLNLGLFNLNWVNCPPSSSWLDA